jgi:hypothetical protein
MLYLVHTVASLAVGVIFRNWKKSAERLSPSPLPSTLPSPPPYTPPPAHGEDARAPGGLAATFIASVKSAALSSVNICGFVVFFTVFLRVMDLTGVIPRAAQLLGELLSPLGFDGDWGRRLLTGAVELSSGVWSLKGAASKLTGSVAMAAFMLGWAGLSVHSQVLSFIGESGLSAKAYIAGKLLQGAISAALAAPLSRFFVAQPPSYGLAAQVSAISSVRFMSAGVISLICCAPLGALTVRFALAARGQRSRR